MWLWIITFEIQTYTEIEREREKEREREREREREMWKRIGERQREIEIEIVTEILRKRAERSNERLRVLMKPLPLSVFAAGRWGATARVHGRVVLGSRRAWCSVCVRATTSSAWLATGSVRAGPNPQSPRSATHRCVQGSGSLRLGRQ